MKTRAPDGSFDFISRAIFGIAATVLALFALVLAGSAVFDFIVAAWSRQHLGISALNGIGYVVVAIAVFDVAKYLIEEEVVRGRELRVASEARRRAANPFDASIHCQENVEQLFYPTFLLIAAILLVLGLGVYQRLSVAVEKQVDDGKAARH